MACSPGGRSWRFSWKPVPSTSFQTRIVPTEFPWASLSSTVVLAALGRAVMVRAAVRAMRENPKCFMGEIIANFVVTRPRGYQRAMARSTGRGSILRESLKSFQGKCTHGFECGGTGDGAGSGGRFSGVGGENLPHDRDVQSGAAGAGGGGTRCAAGASATGGA